MASFKLESADIQGMLVSGYGEMRHSRFLLLRFGARDKARSWLVRQAGMATSAQAWVEGGSRPREALNLALTRTGLEALGWGGEFLTTFSPEFHEGMAEPRRSQALGDTGDSAPEAWEWGAGPEKEVHALVMIYAADPVRLGEMAAQQAGLFQEAGLILVQSVDGSETPGEKEHFGFRDGLSQPLLEGARHGKGPSIHEVKPGEFILGYPNQNGYLPPAPCLPSGQDPHGRLPAHPRLAGWKDWGRNGSYLVFRKLSQDVRGFWDYFARQSQGEADPRQAMVQLASQCMGRWPSGAPLVLSPDRDNEGWEGHPQANEFLYHQDPEGLKCPIGSHVRRSNPRDSMRTGYKPQPSDAKDSLKTSNRHRILRRGRPYGSYLERPLEQGDPGGDRGLLFLCFNADIRRQFEFVQQTWLNNPRFSGLAHDKDPIAGDNDGGPESQMTIPGHPAHRKLQGLPRFVRVRGGAYFFFPGLKALRFLAGES